MCGACVTPSEEPASATLAAGKEVASDTTVVRYIGKIAMKGRQGAFEARHPGWGVTRIGQLTGSIGAEDTGPRGPQAPALLDDEYVYNAREFLLRDIDLHGFVPEELATKTSSVYKPDVPSADVYPDGSGGHEVVFFATTHPAGFEHVDSLTGSLAYAVRFGPDNEITGISTETQIFDTRGMPAGITIALPTQPQLGPNDPNTTAEVIGRTLSSWSDGWMTWLPVREVLASDVVSITPTVLKVPTPHGIRLTVAYDFRVNAPFVASTDPSIQIITELHFVVDGANGDLLADNDVGVQSVLTTDMLDVRCTSSIPYPGACSPSP